MGELYTIGHSLHKVEYFISLLQRYDINYVLDVRSIPYSRYAVQFNRENIDYQLSCSGIKYSFMGQFFGARPKNMDLYCDEGYLDFERVRKSEQFLKGFNNVVKGLNSGNKVALMCTEKDPIDCHRAIMVARAFELSGIYANHILDSGKLESQDSLNERLIKKYFPDRDFHQMTLFDFGNHDSSTDPASLSDAELLNLAYQKRNKEIGYRLDVKENKKE